MCTQLAHKERQSTMRTIHHYSLIYNDPCQHNHLILLTSRPDPCLLTPHRSPHVHLCSSLAQLFPQSHHTILALSHFFSMAAAVLESLVVPRQSLGLQKAAPAASPRMAMASSVSRSRGLGLLPEFRGLRVSRLAAKSVTVPGGARVGRRRGVVCEAQDITIDVPDVTTATWNSVVLESDIPVLVEFWAPWCGPCRMLLPVIGELSKEYAGKLKCVKINTDDCPDTATLHCIRSIPTVIIFKGGEKKETIIGAVKKSQLVSSIEKFL